MELDDLKENYPRLYHMAEAGSWASIKKHGLLSTSALLDLYEVGGRNRKAIESQHRPDSCHIEHSKHGACVVRDQKPMRESALANCLDGMTPTQWYRLLNGHVFFWLTQARLETLLSARAYKNRTHDVLVVDTEKLLERHAQRVRLCAINSGSTLYNPPRRGKQTFCRIADYPFEDRRAARGIGNAVAELAVQRSVPDIRDLVIRVDRRKGDRLVKRIF